MADSIEYCPWCRKEHDRSKACGTAPSADGPYKKGRWFKDEIDRQVSSGFGIPRRLIVDDPFSATKAATAERARKIRDRWNNPPIGTPIADIMRGLDNSFRGLPPVGVPEDLPRARCAMPEEPSEVLVGADIPELCQHGVRYQDCREKCGGCGCLCEQHHVGDDGECWQCDDCPQWGGAPTPQYIGGNVWGEAILDNAIKNSSVATATEEHLDRIAHTIFGMGRRAGEPDSEFRVRMLEEAGSGAPRPFVKIDPGISGMNEDMAARLERIKRAMDEDLKRSLSGVGDAFKGVSERMRQAIAAQLKQFVGGKLDKPTVSKMRASIEKALAGAYDDQTDVFDRAMRGAWCGTGARMMSNLGQLPVIQLFPNARDTPIALWPLFSLLWLICRIASPHLDKGCNSCRPLHGNVRKKGDPMECPECQVPEGRDGKHLTTSVREDPSDTFVARDKLPLPSWREHRRDFRREPYADQFGRRWYVWREYR